MSDDLYWSIKFKLQSNIKALENLYNPTEEHAYTLKELRDNIKFDDFKKKIRYVGRNREIPDCFIPKDLLICNEKNLI